MMRIVSLSLVALSYAILSVYRPVAIAQPSNCCSNRCHFRNDVTNNNLSTAADENNPWDNWYEWSECRANDSTNTTAGNAPPKNASLVCENLNGWMNETGQYYTCCVLEKHRLSVAQLTASLVLGSLTLGFVVVLMLGILRSKEVRRLPFNVYLVFLFGPSSIFIASMIVTSPLIFNCISSVWLANAWMWSFYATVNVLLNAVIAHDIYVLLRNSKRCLRTKPLPLVTVYKRVTAVYVIAVLHGTLTTIVVSNKIESMQSYSHAQRVYIWTTASLIFLLPVFYVLYICIRVWKDKLLPLSGDTRTLAFYFLRIAIVFFIIWFPVAIIELLYYSRFGYDRYLYDLTYLVLAGEIFSAALALTKPDVLLAVKRLLCNGRGYQPWKARRRRPFPGTSSEQGRDEPAGGSRSSDNAVRTSAWDKPDDYGDNISRRRVGDNDGNYVENE